MSKANPENLAEAKAAGQEAANRGANCVPAHCSKYRLLIEGFKIDIWSSAPARSWPNDRSEVHTSELQSLMRLSYAVVCLKKKKHNNNTYIYYKHIQNRKHLPSIL